MQRKTAVSLAMLTLFCLPPAAIRAQSGSSTPAVTQPITPALSVPNALDAPAPEEPEEDWTTISLAHSGLPLAQVGGALLTTVELPDCTRQLLRMEWRTGDPIDLYVIRPRGVINPPVILYLFDYTKDSDIFRSDDWCKQAKQTGIAAVGFVSALAGQRFHSPRQMKQWFVSELPEALASSTHDVQMILNYLDSRGDLNMKEVGMFGQGSGGSIAILATAADSRICALEVIDPWGDWPDWLKSSPRIPETERPAYLKPEFLNKVAVLDPMIYLPQLKGRKVRIEDVLDYPVNPPKAREALAASSPQGTDVVRYEDIMELQKEWHQKGLAGWIGSQLNPKSM